MITSKSTKPKNNVTVYILLYQKGAGNPNCAKLEVTLNRVECG
jgi:hypothetical protein